MISKQDYFLKAQELAKEYLNKLPHTEEDIERVKKIINFYSRKRNILPGSVNSFISAVLWVYAKINFLWELEGELWQQKNLAKICDVSASTLGAKATKIMKDLKIDMMDQRFARQEMVEKNPLAQLCVDPKTGMILKKEDVFYGIPVQRDKHDYYYDAMEELEFGNIEGAIRLLRKAIEIDEHYVAAYVGLSIAYEYKGNKKKIAEFTERAFTETK